MPPSMKFVKASSTVPIYAETRLCCNSCPQSLSVLTFLTCVALIDGLYVQSFGFDLGFNLLL
jgi:hypothetical protein